jgi:hypothetical protein
MTSMEGVIGWRILATQEYDGRALAPWLSFPGQRKTGASMAEFWTQLSLFAAWISTAVADLFAKPDLLQALAALVSIPLAWFAAVLSNRGAIKGAFVQDALERRRQREQEDKARENEARELFQRRDKQLATQILYGRLRIRWDVEPMSEINDQTETESLFILIPTTIEMVQHYIEMISHLYRKDIAVKSDIKLLTAPIDDAIIELVGYKKFMEAMLVAIAAMDAETKIQIAHSIAANGIRCSDNLERSLHKVLEWMPPKDRKLWIDENQLAFEQMVDDNQPARLPPAMLTALAHAGGHDLPVRTTRGARD